MKVVLVWVLIVSSGGASHNEVEQLGPYSTLDDCETIKQSKPLKRFSTECLEINMVFK